jgi:endo-1,3-1,4-beta-glycanase ExoK
MKIKTNATGKKLFESLESRNLFAAVLPAFADQIGLINTINPTPTFADEFDGSTLDTSKWQVRDGTRHRIEPNSPEFAWNTPDAVKVSNGELNLIAHNDPVTGTYESGWIQTALNGTSSGGLVPGSTANFTQPYGYWEAKLKMSSISGMWNAFWVHSSPMPEVADDPTKANHPEIYGTEMDVVEQSAVRIDAASGDTVHTTTHANGYGQYHISSSSHTNVATLPNTGSSAGNYHIYGLLWTPTSVSVYMDGTLAYRETNPNMVSKVAQYAILSNEIGAPGSKTLGSGRLSWGAVPAGGYGSVETSTAKLTADYVRVWALKGTAAPIVPPTFPTAPAVPTQPTRPTFTKIRLTPLDLPTKATNITRDGGDLTSGPQGPASYI